MSFCSSGGYLSFGGIFEVVIRISEFKDKFDFVENREKDRENRFRETCFMSYGMGEFFFDF